jgi:hypothetical protein
MSDPAIDYTTFATKVHSFTPASPVSPKAGYNCRLQSEKSVAQINRVQALAVPADKRTLPSPEQGYVDGNNWVDSQGYECIYCDPLVGYPARRQNCDVQGSSNDQ